MEKTLIRVTVGGCGIKIKDGNGTVRHELKTPKDGPFLCEIEQAERLVSLGVAAFVIDAEEEEAQQGTDLPADDMNEPAPATEEPEAEEEPEADGSDAQEEEKRLTADQLLGMTNAALENLAGDLGIDVSKCKKKADYVAAILAAEEEPEAEEEEPLELSVADPV